MVHHFHTRTKTGRAPALDGAAPTAFVELAADDAERLGVGTATSSRSRSRRGRIGVPVRLGGIEPGVAFVPFHYGDEGTTRAEPTAANRLTISGWDPVSKQPYFKYAAVAIRPVGARPVEVREGEAPSVLAGRGDGTAGREPSASSDGALAGARPEP